MKQRIHHHLLGFWAFARKSHKHTAVVSACFVILLGTSILLIQHVRADAGWLQTDWSGGVGTSTTNQYSSASNADTSTAGQVSLTAGSNQLSNTGFDSDLSSWNGGTAPDQVSGLALWLKADAITGLSDGATLASWADSSGNNHTATQSNTTLKPTYKTNIVNGQPVVRFDGTDDVMSVAGSVTHGTMVTTIKHGSSNQVIAEVGGGTISSRRGLFGSACPTYCSYDQYYANGASVSGGGGPLSVFKIVTGQSPTTPVVSTSFALGQGTPGYAYINGDIPELAIYDTSLSTANRQLVEAYMQAKYATPSSPYVTVTRDTATYRTGGASAKLVAGSSGGQYVQSKNVGDTNLYKVEAYAYTTGAAVTSADAELSYNNATISTTYTSVGGGWYKLAGTVTGANAARNYGVQVKASKTVYLDDFSVVHYPTSGTITSAIFDGTTAEDWGTLTYNTTTPAGTAVSVKVRSGNQANLSDATAFASCSATSNAGDTTSACAADKTRYVQYQVTLTGDGTATPTFQDNTIAYSASDTVTPTTNASSILAYRSNGGASVSSNGWVSSSPYFTWTAGADDGDGSGIKGYCLYVGQDASGNPVTTKGYLGTSPLNTGGACQFAVAGNSVDLSASGYLASALPTSNDPYYITVKAIDSANNVYSGSAAAFHFRYDSTAPANPSFITAPSQFVANKAVSMTWPTAGGDSASDANSGVAGLQYRIGSSGIWYGDTHNSNQDSSDLLSNDGSYTTQSSPDFASLNEGNNIVYFRTWDVAGNVSPAYATTVIKLNTSSPSSPQNITATPGSNTTNSFALSWLAPATYTGSVSNITYCYSVNSLPNSSNCTFTAAGTTSLPAGAYAAQPGENTFYVVAKDEAGNINYATADSTTFTANTAAPGVPLNVDIADISVKTTSNWKLALSWEEPTQTGAGVASYKVMRSTNGTTFNQIASTSGTSYVDGGLTQQTYYYKVKACDSANNCGALTTAVHDLPTGKFTSPAEVLTGPAVGSITTKKAAVSWVTDRTSDSKVAFGMKPGTYSSDEIANSDQTVNHGINLVNLTPGTTYYYIVKWTDEDGNTGTSAESSFTTLPAPSIKDVTITGVNISTATLTFTSTRANSVKLYYGKSDSFGALKTINTSESTSTYSIQLTGLDDGTKYYFKLNTIDGDGNEYDSPQANSFTTPSRPRITNLRFQPVLDQPTSTQQITWNTNVPSTSELAYGPNGQAQQNATNPTLTIDHSILISGLNDNTEYSLTAQSRDLAGNLAVSDRQVFHTALDTRPPKISGLKVTSSIKGTGTDAAGQIIVSWKTDEPATSQVAYGEGSDNSSYNTSTAEDKALVTDHAVVVSNLSTSQIFHLQALSKDTAGNQAHSDSRTTIIGNATDSVISIIFNALQKVFGGF